MQASSYLPENNTHPETAHRHGHVSTSTRIRKMVLIALGVSLLLQTVSIITPGWQIGSGDNYSYQSGLFYFVHCEGNSESESCETKSFTDSFFDTTEKEKKRKKKSLGQQSGSMLSNKCQYCKRNFSRRDAMLRYSRKKRGGICDAYLPCTEMYPPPAPPSPPLSCEVYQLSPQEIYPTSTLGTNSHRQTTELHPFTMMIPGPTGINDNFFPVHFQVGVTLAWLCTLISVIVLQRIYRKQEPAPKTWSILACTMAVTGIIMGQVIYAHLLSIARRANRSSVGFPYSLFFYIQACIVILISVAGFLKCLLNDITTRSQAGADTGRSDDMTNQNDARAYTCPYDDVNTLSHTRADTGPSDDMTTPNRARTDTEPYNYINPISQARADTGPDDDMTTTNRARTDTEPYNYINPISQARDDTGPDDDMNSLSQNRAGISPYSYINPLSQARDDTGSDDYMTPISQARVDTGPYHYINPLSQATDDTHMYNYINPLCQARPDTGPSAMLELTQVPTTRQVSSSKLKPTQAHMPIE